MFVMMQGTIPDLGDLQLLSNILLDSNQLTGMLPVWAGSLPNLTNLWLDNNRLMGSIPKVRFVKSLISRIEGLHFRPEC